MKKVFPAMMLASAVTLGLFGCSDPSAPVDAAAAEVDLDSVGEVGAVGHSSPDSFGSTEPYTYTAVITGDDPLALLAEKLEDAGYEQTSTNIWKRSEPTPFVMVSVREMTAGDVISTGSKRLVIDADGIGVTFMTN